MALRDHTVDNGKHAPAGMYAKADVAVPAFWPTSMGAWDAPAVQVWTDHDPDGDGDESYLSEQSIGTQMYDPTSVYKSSDFNGRKA